MFENGLFASVSPPGRRGGWLKRAISLGISLAIHAVVLVLLVTYYVPLEVLDLDPYVRNVFIAPPLERLKLPDRTDSDPDPPGDQDSEVSLAARAAVILPRAPDDIPSRDRISLPERLEIPSHLQERFDLMPLPAERVELPPDLSFTIAPDRAPPRFEYGPGPGDDTLRVDLGRHIRPALPVLPAGPGTSPSRSGGGETGSSGSDAVTRQVEIARWADVAVAVIMEKWQVPHRTADREEDEFEIAVVILKDGWIASTEVVTPARVPELQAAAMKALELSSPLPRLPRSFSRNSLEISLVFARK